MNDTKFIEFYVREVYGKPLAYIKNPADADILKSLLDAKTINAAQRSLIEDLTGGRVRFVQVMG